MKPSFILLVASLLLATGAVAQTPCSWSLVGGVFSAGSGTGYVSSLEGFDDGSGPSLFAGGGFINAGGISANNIARWSGNSWSPVGAGLAFTVEDLAVFDDGSGPNLYAGGYGLAKWDGTNWLSPVGGPINFVRVLAVGDDGTGPALYAGGLFGSVGGTLANNIARWDGTTWSQLGSGVTGTMVGAITGFDDGSGPAIFVGGSFWSAGGSPANNIAKWDGSSWSPLGPGISLGTAPLVLCVFDDGTGPALYAGGHFTLVGGIQVNSIAKWDGSTWSALGGGVMLTAGLHGAVTGLSVFDDGTGPALYAMGGFQFAGGVPVQGIAKWDGSSWSAAGSMPLSNPRPLTVCHDGLGAALYAGGWVPQGIGVSTSVARWSCGSTISLTATQASPGSSVFVNNANLTPGNEYYNIFSFDLCPGGAGTGPFGGLCVTSPANHQFVLTQLRWPLGSSLLPLFHFMAPSSYVNWGPLTLPPITLEAITFDFTGGVLGSISQVATITVQ